MVIRKSKIQAYVLKMVCDCGGELKGDGGIYPTDPPQYKHICDKCGKIEVIWNNCYPQIGYEEINEDDLR